MKKLLVTFFVMVTLMLSTTYAVYVRFSPVTITQPDGSTINCFASGDEFFNWLHDADGYTIIQGNDGYYYYAIKENEVIKASTYRVGSHNPASKGISKWVIIDEKQYKARREAFYSHRDKSVKAPHSGTLNNIVVYIRFADQSEFSIPRQTFDNKFNHTTAVSLRNYYREVSYNMLDVVSHHYPSCAMTVNLSYQDSHPRGYFSPYNATTNPNGYNGDSERTTREHQLLADAVAAIEVQVPDTLNIDGDNDGFADNVCFIIRGGNDNWAELLWAHRWYLFSQNVYINGKQVYDYTFQPETQNDVQTLCHEMFHALGAPDLYRYVNQNITPAGVWDLMESGFGHMGAYMKYRYSDNTWINDIPEITSSGTYWLKPLTSATGNCYKIPSPYSTTEYFVVEYRKMTGAYEGSLPSSGILVYRIDTITSGNASGPPDEVYIYRPGGTLSSDGSIIQATFSANASRTIINDATNPSSFLQNGSVGGLDISQVSGVGDSISFYVNLDQTPTVLFTANKTTVIEASTINFTHSTSNSPTALQWFFEGGTPSSSTLANPSVVYSTPGQYDVKLIATNSFGTDSLIKSNYITITPTLLTCGNTIPLEFNVSYNGNTTGSNSVVDKYSCKNSLESGPEVVHTINVTDTGTLTATLSNLSSDLDIVILDTCKENHCLAMGNVTASVSITNSGIYYVVVDGFKGAVGPYTVTVTHSILNAEQHEINNISVLPNPASDIINVQIPLNMKRKVNCKIINLLGQPFFHKELSEKAAIDVKLWPKGLYFIELSDGKAVKTIKILVNH